MFNKLLILFKYFDLNFRKKIFQICVLTFFGGILEMLGIGILFPILDFISNNRIHPSISIIIDQLQIQSNNDLIIILLIFFLSFFILKNLTLSYFSHKQWSLTSDVRHHISVKLITNYIMSDYSFYMKNNTSKITRNSTTLINSFNTNVLIPVTILFTEFFVIILLIFLAMYINPLGSLILFSSLFIPILLYYKFIKPVIRFYGIENQKSEALRIKYINEMIGAIKEIKILAKENFFLKRYIKTDLNVSLANFKSTFFTQVTKYFLEVNLILAIFIFILFELHYGKSLKEIIPLLGFYAITGFKVIPSINRIVNASQVLKFGESILDILNKEFSRRNIALNYKNQSEIDFENGIFIKNLTFSYNLNTPVLKNLNLKIIKNRIYGFCGETGSGKTTLLNLLLGLIKPISGSIFIDDKNLKYNNKIYRNLVGFVPQEIFLIDDSIINNIAFGETITKHNRQKVEMAIQEAGLSSFVQSLKKKYHTHIGERGIRLSGGQRQRIGIARALFFGAKILIFDEATSSLDYKTEKTVMSNINRLKGNYTILIVAHRLSTLFMCDIVYELKNHKLKKIDLR